MGFYDSLNISLLLFQISISFTNYLGFLEVLELTELKID